MKRLIIAIMIVVGLVGCSIAKDLRSVTSEQTAAEVTNTVASVKLTDAELVVLSTAKSTYTYLTDKWDIHNIAFIHVVNDYTAIRADYEILRREYIKVRKVILSNYDKYTAEDIKYLKDIDAKLHRVHMSFEKAQEAEEVFSAFKLTIMLVARIM